MSSQVTKRGYPQFRGARTKRYIVCGKLCRVWECDCPDCALFRHVDSPVEVQIIVSAINESAAADVAQQEIEGKREWGESEWNTEPQVEQVR